RFVADLLELFARGVGLQDRVIDHPREVFARLDAARAGAEAHAADAHERVDDTLFARDAEPAPGARRVGGVAGRVRIGAGIERESLGDLVDDDVHQRVDVAHGAEDVRTCARCRLTSEGLEATRTARR